ncbi:YceI family protein [Taibaiella koreensis]|uniref:YceI family protein n=1 Tax=Taibaiella koreensis TaxID=1268548 RepID=UPI000E59E4F5|nr:YceI family protein [Taibaiella koreensis]
MATTNWAFDPAHSELQFKVKHLLISTVTGNFKELTGSVVAGDSFDDARIQFETSIDSLSTHNEQRDQHLKGADFFEADQFPKLSFTSTRFEKKGEDHYNLEGDLTIKGITKPVSLNVEYNGTAQDPYGNTKAGFELNGKINRSEFGLTWNALTEAGGMVVSDEVKLLGNIQLIKQ